MTECPGHFGTIKLAVPVYHYGKALPAFSANLHSHAYRFPRKGQEALGDSLP